MGESNTCVLMEPILTNCLELGQACRGNSVGSGCYSDARRLRTQVLELADVAQSPVSLPNSCVTLVRSLSPMKDQSPHRDATHTVIVQGGCWLRAVERTARKTAAPCPPSLAPPGEGGCSLLTRGSSSFPPASPGHPLPWAGGISLIHAVVKSWRRARADHKLRPFLGQSLTVPSSKASGSGQSCQTHASSFIRTVLFWPLSRCLFSPPAAAQAPSSPAALDLPVLRTQPTAMLPLSLQKLPLYTPFSFPPIAPGPTQMPPAP